MFVIRNFNFHQYFTGAKLGPKWTKDIAEAALWTAKGMAQEQLDHLRSVGMAGDWIGVATADYISCRWHPANEEVCFHCVLPEGHKGAHRIGDQLYEENDVGVIYKERWHYLRELDENTWTHDTSMAGAYCPDDRSPLWAVQGSEVNGVVRHAACLTCRKVFGLLTTEDHWDRITVRPAPLAIEIRPASFDEVEGIGWDGTLRDGAPPCHRLELSTGQVIWIQGRFQIEKGEQR